MAAGKKLLEKKDPARAILQFRNAIQATPTDPEAYYQLGLASLAAGDLRQGALALRKTLELNPKHAAAQLRLASLMTYADDPALLKDAERRLRGLLQSTPDDAETLHALALAELKLGEPEDATRLLERAIAAAPQELLIAVTLAQAKIAQKDWKAAEEILRKACENSPKSVDAVITLGQFFSAQNRSAEAEQQFRRAISMDPHSMAAVSDLATLLYRTGRKEEAEKNFRLLAASSDKTYESNYRIFLYQDGRHEEALREFERIAKEDPEDRWLVPALYLHTPLQTGCPMPKKSSIKPYRRILRILTHYCNEGSCSSGRQRRPG